MANLTISLSDLDKQQFSEFCEYNGMSVSTAINIFIKKVLDCGAIPFTIGKTPNWATRRAMREGDKFLEKYEKNPEKYKKNPKKYNLYDDVDEMFEEMRKW